MTTINYEEYKKPLCARLQKINKDYIVLNRFRTTHSLRDVIKDYKYIDPRINTWDEFDTFFLGEIDEIEESLNVIEQKERTPTIDINKYSRKATRIFKLINATKDYYIKCYEYLTQNKMSNEFDDIDEKWECMTSYSRLKLIDIKSIDTYQPSIFENDKYIQTIFHRLNDMYKQMEEVIKTCHMEHIQRIKRNMFKYFKSAICPYEKCMNEIKDMSDKVRCPHCFHMLVLKFNEDIITINDTPATISYYFEKVYR